MKIEPSSIAEIDGAEGHGIEIRLDSLVPSSQWETTVFVESYNGKVRVVVWGGMQEDPVYTMELDAIGAEVQR